MKEELDKILKPVLPNTMDYDVEHYKAYLISDNVKGKNYIVYTEKGDLKLYGVSFKSSRYEIFARNFMKEVALAIVEDRIDDVKTIYNKYRNNIINHKLEAVDFSQTQEVKRTYETYLSTKVMKDKFYEMINEYNLNPQIGERIKFYITKNGSYKPVDMYNKNEPDEDVDYLLKSLDSYKARFNGILTQEQYETLFKNYEYDSISNYKYVDVCYQIPEKDGDMPVFSKWKRINTNKLNDFNNENWAKGYATFTSVQTYKNKILTENEPYIMPLYFDLDGDNIDDVIGDTKKLVEYFKPICGESAIQTYFSGAKGVHVIINPNIFNITPSPTLNKKISYIKKKLTKLLDLKTVCKSPESIRKMLRNEGSINLKTNLYKTRFYNIDELNDIKLLAKTRKIKDIYIKNEYYPINNAIKWYENFCRYYNEKEIKPKDLIQLDFMPPCVRELYTNNIKDKGTRNKSTLVLITFFRDYGKPIEETIKIMQEWYNRIPKNLYNMNKSEMKQKITSVAKSVYGNNYYSFACEYIRPLGVKCLESCKLYNNSK